MIDAERIIGNGSVVRSAYCPGAVEDSLLNTQAPYSLSSVVSRKTMNIRSLLLLAAAVPLTANAWWNEAWTTQHTVELDPLAAGVELSAPVERVVVPVRLHSGNFDFLGARGDGGDLRFIADDDKTPLPFRLERYDAVNELALAWVEVPRLAPGAKTAIKLYSGNPGAPAEPVEAGVGAGSTAVFHFGDSAEGRVPQDASGNAHHAQAAVDIEPAGLLGASARLTGTGIVLSPSPALALGAGGSFSFSTWVRPDAIELPIVLYRQGALALRVSGGELKLEGAGQSLSGGPVAAGQWQHVAVSVGGGEAALYVNGKRTGAGAAVLPAAAGEVVIGDGLRGLLDMVVVDAVARSADRIRLEVASQGGDARLVRVMPSAGEVAEESHGYLGILVANLTIDAWVVIVILMAMFVIAALVMVVKARMISITDADNRVFLNRFRLAHEDLLELDRDAVHPHSSLYRLYQAGLREIRKRTDAQGGLSLSGASLDAIKASIDADMVRESHRLNAKMVMLTIAISGGPFLGLLGTVVGVMITFAAIAAAGDVNVNAIAPGIAAALLATVAGLAVAIPALFGYNYLASRIKNISADMQIFVDEFVTRVAERHAR